MKKEKHEKYGLFRRKLPALLPTHTTSVPGPANEYATLDNSLYNNSIPILNQTENTKTYVYIVKVNPENENIRNLIEKSIKENINRTELFTNAIENQLKKYKLSGDTYISDKKRWLRLIFDGNPKDIKNKLDKIYNALYKLGFILVIPENRTF